MWLKSLRGWSLKNSFRRKPSLGNHHILLGNPPGDFFGGTSWGVRTPILKILREYNSTIENYQYHTYKVPKVAF